MKSVKPVGTEILFVLFLVVLGILSRLIPHPWNFTAIGAMALFSGFSFRSNKILILIPLLSLFISDAALGFYNGMIYTYIGFAVGMVLSVGYFSKQITLSVGARANDSLGARATTLAGLSIVSSFLFFLITNFGVWLGSGFYPQNTAGLITAYVAGLPFFLNQIAGDLVYGAIIFGVFEYLNAPKKLQQSI